MALFGLIDTGERAARKRAQDSWAQWDALNQDYLSKLRGDRGFIENRMGQDAITTPEWNTMVSGMSAANRSATAQAQNSAARRANQSGLLGSGLYQKTAADIDTASGANLAGAMANLEAKRAEANRLQKNRLLQLLMSSTGQFGSAARDQQGTAAMFDNYASQMESNDPFGQLLATAGGYAMGGWLKGLFDKPAKGTALSNYGTVGSGLSTFGGYDKPWDKSSSSW